MNVIEDVSKCSNLLYYWEKHFHVGILYWSIPRSDSWLVIEINYIDYIVFYFARDGIISENDHMKLFLFQSHSVQAKFDVRLNFPLKLVNQSVRNGWMFWHAKYRRSKVTNGKKTNKSFINRACTDTIKTCSLCLLINNSSSKLNPMSIFGHTGNLNDNWNEIIQASFQTTS